ncbi:MAG: CusA/CzcA family heavy metal efflux RND transporter [Bacteroidales bacterium]|nr:CusA/CzcA family heavy metal efflux RND transporter [Bacteroidales bacterium]
MINRIIAFSVRNKFIIGLFILVWIGWGIFSAINLPLNTLPDLTNNQVKVTTYTPDLATEEVERLITYPIELEMGNLPGLKEIRSVSKFGLSDITLVFEEDMGMYKPRQLVKERLKSAAAKLPEGAGEPTMGPMTSGLGEIYQYVLSTKPGYDTVYNAMELREIQDWIVKKELINIPGVVGVNTMGGYLKQYEVAVNPDRLQSYNLSITDIYNALKRNNANTGGSYIEKNKRAYFVRGQGLTQSLDDIRKIVLKNNNGTPLQIGDVSNVKYGYAPRFGAFTYNGKGEAVGGKIMMLRGENPAEVIGSVKERLPQLKAALPEGVQMKPFLDRSSLISKTTNTVSENLALGALIVIFVLIMLMGSLRSGLITASVIPLSLLFALGIMYTFDFSANLISLGAIDFGIIIDGALIIIEFTVFQISRHVKLLRNLKGKELQAKLNEITIWSSGRMMRTAFFGQMIILIVFIPILTLTGQEGDMFRPMAIAFGSALVGAIILCLTYVPMMSALFLRPEKSDKPKIADKIIGRVRNGYRIVLGKMLRYRYAVTSVILLLLVSAIFIFGRLGSVFIPQLDEGDFAIHPILQPGTSLSETVEINTKLENVLLNEFPDEVEQVATKIGAGEIPTDPMSLEMAKMIINLKPKEEWKRTETKDELANMMKQEMSATVPGVSFFFSQPIEMLFKHLTTGSTADILMNIYGNNLDTLYQYGQKAKGIISDIPGAGDLNVQKVIGLPQIVIDYDRDKLARYGLDIETVNRTIQAGYSGAKAGIIYEGERQFSQVVRLKEEFRNNPRSMGELLIMRPNGQQVQLKEVADIRMQAGPASISREAVKRKIELDINIGDRDTESFIQAVQQELGDKLDLPKGYNIAYEGEFESLQRAKKRLSWIVPLVLAFIFTLLYFTFNSFKQALLVFSAVPLAAIGGVFSLWIRGMPFSISAGVGFIALFGIAVLNGLVLMSFFNELKSEGMHSVFKRIYHGTDMRLRPVILTALTDALGFLPMAMSTSSGAEVQRPLATVVVGGLVTATLLTLIMLPIIYSFSERIRNIPSLGQIVGRTGKRINNKSLMVGLVLTGLMLPGTIQAQESGKQTTQINDVEDAIEIALENNPYIKEGVLQVKQKQKLKKTTWDLPDTKLAYEKENNAASRENWSVEQEIKNPAEYIAGSKLANQRIAQSKTNLEKRKIQLIKDVRSAYFNVLYAKEKVKLLADLKNIFSELSKAGKLRYETGDVSYLEKVSAQAKYKAIKVAEEEALSLLARNTNTLMNKLFVDDTVSLAETQLNKIAMEESYNGMDSLNSNPDIALFKQQWKTKQAESKAVKSISWPDPFFRYSQNEFAGNESFSAIELGVRIPVDIWAEKGRNQAAKIAAEASYENFLRVKNDMMTAYNNNIKNLETYSRQLDYFEESRLKEANMIIKSASKQYKAGNIDYLQFIQFFDQATQIRLNYLDILKTYNQNIIELQYLIGQ